MKNDDEAANSAGGKPSRSGSQDDADRIERTSGQQRASEAEETSHRQAEDAERRSGDQDYDRG